MDGWMDYLWFGEDDRSDQVNPDLGTEGGISKQLRGLQSRAGTRGLPR